MKKFVCLFVAVAFLLMGCAGWQANTTNSYIVAGSVTGAAHGMIKPSCDQGLIQPEPCADLKVAYNLAVQSYVSAGNILVLALTTSDAVQSDYLQEQFAVIMAQYRDAANSLILLIRQIEAAKTKTMPPPKIKKAIDPTTITLIMAAIETAISLIPNIINLVSGWGSDEVSVEELVQKIKTAQASVPFWE